MLMSSQHFNINTFGSPSQAMYQQDRVCIHRWFTWKVAEFRFCVENHGIISIQIYIGEVLDNLLIFLHLIGHSKYWMTWADQVIDWLNYSCGGSCIHVGHWRGPSLLKGELISSALWLVDRARSWTLQLYLSYGIPSVLTAYWFLVEAGSETVCDEADMPADFRCCCAGVCWNNLTNNSFD